MLYIYIYIYSMQRWLLGGPIALHLIEWINNYWCNKTKRNNFNDENNGDNKNFDYDGDNNNNNIDDNNDFNNDNNNDFDNNNNNDLDNDNNNDNLNGDKNGNNNNFNDNNNATMGRFFWPNVTKRPYKLLKQKPHSTEWSQTILWTNLSLSINISAHCPELPTVR